MTINIFDGCHFCCALVTTNSCSSTNLHPRGYGLRWDSLVGCEVCLMTTQLEKLHRLYSVTKITEITMEITEITIKEWGGGDVGCGGVGRCE